MDGNPITYFQARTNLIGSNSSPNGGSAGWTITPVFMYPTATIHYVEENAYRQLNGLDKEAAIPERSGGADYSSTAPGTTLDLTDLKTSIQLGDKIGTSKSGLKPLFSTTDKSQTNLFIDLNTHQEVKGEARPTYEDVINQSEQPVGYAYIGDDIDKGANNVISPIVWPDGHITYDKHYYILERQMPSPIKIHKTDDQDQGLKDVTFDLYRINGETETPVASGLTTNENGDLYASQAESVTQSDLSKVTTSESYDPQTGYIVQDDLAYLTPGTYRLKETTVPEGYKMTHFDFTVKAVQDMVADTSTPVPVQSFTFKNKSTYPVEYSFVSADNKKELPDEVKTLLPKDDELYVKGDIVNAHEPETKSFKAKDGVWNFKAYDANSKQVNDENLKDGKIQFVGTWTFSPYAIALNQIPTIDAKDQVLTVNDSFDPMQGVSAHDEEEGDLTEKVEVIENNVPTDENKKTTKEGSYTVTYRVSDSQGASSIKTITVVVNPVMEELNHIPYITAEDQVLTIGDPLNLFYHVSAMDDEDGDLTGSVKLVKSTVPVDENGNTIKVGAYTVIYSVSDSQGASSTKTVSVVVNPKMESINQIPIIHAKDKIVSVGDVFDVMQDVTAEDVEDGDVTGNLRVLENNVPMDDNGKMTKAGLFTITYQVTDSKGASSTKTITVTVNENTNNQPSNPEDGKNPSNDKGNSSTQRTERNSAKETKSSKGTKTSTGTYAAVFSGLASVSLAMLCGFVIVRKRQR
ncbi:collagen-binding surface protein [Faecalicoccus pleomorphus]|uniref:Collagen-binding surface protein n=1 Tax=Faecalicoccus pleomorphus TaxID=1323 RepID=A0A380LLG7_9FIRM|nr:SHIRT domain-containing protein [Faecalicoccus pleomorphus]SUO04055.1 collagen-binding surface protein [Faecalicoccus pleomorphus]